MNGGMQMNLFNDLQSLIQRLNTSVKKLSDYGNELAVNERDYKVTLRQEALKLRQEKKYASNINKSNNLWNTRSCK